MKNILQPQFEVVTPISSNEERSVGLEVVSGLAGSLVVLGVTHQLEIPVLTHEVATFRSIGSTMGPTYVENPGSGKVELQARESNTITDRPIASTHVIPMSETASAADYVNQIRQYRKDQNVPIVKFAISYGGESGATRFNPDGNFNAVKNDPQLASAALNGFIVLKASAKADPGSLHTEEAPNNLSERVFEREREILSTLPTPTQGGTEPAYINSSIEVPITVAQLQSAVNLAREVGYSNYHAFSAALGPYEKSRTTEQQKGLVKLERALTGNDGRAGDDYLVVQALTIRDLKNTKSTQNVCVMKTDITNTTYVEKNHSTDTLLSPVLSPVIALLGLAAGLRVRRRLREIGGFKAPESTTIASVKANTATSEQKLEVARFNILRDKTVDTDLNKRSFHTRSRNLAAGILAVTGSITAFLGINTVAALWPNYVVSQQSHLSKAPLLDKVTVSTCRPDSFVSRFVTPETERVTVLVDSQHLKPKDPEEFGFIIR
jgi:hypothetical protein